jgi:hypothetical protein
MQAADYQTDYTLIPLAREALDALKEGENVIAVHCRNDAGPQFVDVGMVATVSGELITVVQDSRSQPQDWKYTTEDPLTTHWVKAEFADDTWSAGPGGFGGGGAAQDLPPRSSGALQPAAQRFP